MSNLDPRCWLIWGTAVTMPALVGRNPFPLLAVLIAIIGVRWAWSAAMPGLVAWRGLVRLAVAFAGIGVLFNVLTVRAGDQIIAHFPDWMPLVGAGKITANALVFGLLSGLALLVLVFAGTTVGPLLDWTAMVRLIPDRLSTVAVAGSIAFAFIPQTAAALADVREAQAARGHKLRGGRDLLPILVPVLAIGLERAVTLSESLESRAFGAPEEAARPGLAIERTGVALALALAASGAYLLAIGHAAMALAAAAAIAILLAPMLLRSRNAAVGRTRYRAPAWGRRDTVVALFSAIALVATVLSLRGNGSGVQYAPYPALGAPVADLPLIAALLGLLAPAFVAPAGRAVR